MIKRIFSIIPVIMTLFIPVIAGVLLPQTAFSSDMNSIDTGTTCWMLTSTALVLLMVPGLAMFYGGLV